MYLLCRNLPFHAVASRYRTSITGRRVSSRRWCSTRTACPSTAPFTSQVRTRHARRTSLASRRRRRRRVTTRTLRPLLTLSMRLSPCATIDGRLVHLHLARRVPHGLQHGLQRRRVDEFRLCRLAARRRQVLAALPHATDARHDATARRTRLHCRAVRAEARATAAHRRVKIGRAHV